MKGADPPSRAPRTLMSFNSQADLDQFATGCDADIGGTSTVHLELDQNAKHNESIGREATAVFWGDMRLGVKVGLEGRLRGGYAGFRNKVCMCVCVRSFRTLSQLILGHPCWVGFGGTASRFDRVCLES